MTASGDLAFRSLFILGFNGREVCRQAPPIPERIITTDGAVVLTRDDILTGQQVWQSTGGQQLGSISEGLWYARSADFLQQPWLEQLRWLRIVGDTVFLAGAGAFTWFMSGLWFG